MESPVFHTVFEWRELGIEHDSDKLNATPEATALHEAKKPGRAGGLTVLGDG